MRMTQPFRLWMTGGLAMVLAGLVGRPDSEEDERFRLARVSPYGVAETVQRIEASAERQGMQVMVRMLEGRRGDTHTMRQVIVLESSQGGTPVSMQSENARPHLPLRVVVQRGADGVTQVLLPESTPSGSVTGLPFQVQNDVAGLPEVVEQALNIETSG
jgi:uncharacterized protein (DUF302 family)